MSLTNPFSTGFTLEVPNSSTRFPVGLPASANSVPTVNPTTYTTTLTSFQITNTTSALAYILGFYPAGFNSAVDPPQSNPFGMTYSQYNAAVAVHTLFSGLSAGSHTFTTLQLQNIVITSQMIRSWNNVNINPLTKAQINTLSGIMVSAHVTAGGASYVTGTYSNVQITGGSGSLAYGTITVNGGGQVSSIVITAGGFGFQSGDILTCANSDLNSPAGYGFTATPSTFAPTAVTIVSPSSTNAFPAGAYTIVANDQYFICEQPGTGNWYVSASGDGTNWPGLTTATIESRSDQVIAVDAFSGGTVVIFGSRSMEFWQDNGTQPFQYVRNNGAQQDWGLAARWSRAYFGNSIAFLGQNFQGQTQVLMFEGYVPNPISTPDIDNIINSFPVINDAIAYSYTLDGHQFYRITFPTANRTLDYDLLTGIWNEAQSGISSTPQRHLSALGVSYNYSNYASDATNGNIYYIDSTNNTDNGSLIQREADSVHINSGGDEDGLDEVLLEMDTGNGTPSANAIGDSDNPQIGLRVSKNYGKTFGGTRFAPLGKQGQYVGPLAKWRLLGTSKDFVLKFICTSAVPFFIKFASATMRKGINRK